MHLNVSDIMDLEVGHRKSYEIRDEQPSITDIKLARPLSGDLGLLKTDFGLAAEGVISTELELECHRCLRAFHHPVTFKLAAEFALAPTEEQWEITSKRNEQTIDLAPAVRQELLLNLPIKQLCQADCMGLCSICGQRQEGELHHHPGQEIVHRPTIKTAKKEK